MAPNSIIEFFFFNVFIYIRDRESGRRGKEREFWSRLSAKDGNWCGAPSQDAEIAIWAKSRVGFLTDWATQMHQIIEFLIIQRNV